MSANLTVYSMAIAAEHPLLLRAAHQASLAAQADTAPEHRSGQLVRHLGSVLRRSLRSGISAQRWIATGVGQRLAEQPAG